MSSFVVYTQIYSKARLRASTATAEKHRAINPPLQERLTQAVAVPKRLPAVNESQLLYFINQLKATQESELSD